MKKETGFHSKNKHKLGYDLHDLCKASPELLPFVFINTYNNKTIDFTNPKAVKALNTALLIKHYNITFWEFLDTNLCPPIPGRVDYIHHISDLLDNSGIRSNVRVLDIGTGATCIYPILGNAEYNWTFVATDIDKESLKIAQKNIDKNQLQDDITLRHQKNKLQIFKNVLKTDDMFSVSMCNPPFYKSEAEALEATTKKLQGLKIAGKAIRNFAGTKNELWYNGGEKSFIHNYLYESSLFKKQCVWYTTLVSKKELVKSMYMSLNKLGVTDIKTIHMSQGNKISRIVAWTFQ
ncbi:23S rRNA methyltransferase [Pseudalgibacter alginicilyticus]|uniref:Ribosomal RNA large subunit methyltransferase F n=1 Tax=Pseudalgibacter alginicilyticus TaxID=1736674 RepID=A0A0P0CUZ4_9FLAO|nr:23S rRNA (adenine(1618)-N(6))-methyltransferase RlmF [Pseudalgibacter alginicilyticus]ALJ04202.1 23S rRNA methyltransferase [Pseudalgibacter alginicilyticus]